MVAIPDVVVSLYYGLIASDQYVAEARLTVGSGAIPKMDGLGSITGVPPIMIIQDIQIVTNYIHSRTMVEQLERAVGLRDVYSAPSIDWWARFRRDKPIEKFTDYWKGMSSASIGMPSGIVTVTVRAFTPEDAKRVGDAVVSQSEDLINDLNDRMRRDTVRAAERDMQQAAKDLGRARMAMEFERNAEGVIDVGSDQQGLDYARLRGRNGVSHRAAGIPDAAQLRLAGCAADASVEVAHCGDAGTTRPVAGAAHHE